VLRSVRQARRGRAGTYRVTRTAEALAELVAGALTEAASCGSPALAQTLAAAVRDAAELAGALPPAVRAHDLQVAPPSRRGPAAARPRPRLRTPPVRRRPPC